MDVVVMGVGQTKFGSHPDKSLPELFAQAFFEAFDSSNIELKDIEALYIGNFVGEITDGSANLGGFIADEIGLSGIQAMRYESACCSSAVAFKEACLAIKHGIYDCVVVGGVEKLKSAGTAIGTRALATAVDGVYEINTGLTFPGVFALVARLYAETYGIPLEKLREMMAYVSIKNHRYGARNPKAQFYNKLGNLKVEDVLNSKMISSPLTLLDCCPMTDGASAVVLASESFAKDRIDEPVYVRGVGQSSAGSLFRQKKEIVKALPRRKSSEMAYKMAGLSPKDIDVALVHDCFTIAEIVALEAMGFFNYGEGAKATAEGLTNIGGDVAVNIDGGLIGKGHPVGATGTAQIYSAVKILRNELDFVKVDAENVITDTLGGDFGTLVNVILSVHRR
ncbi:thiolase C-terminal domain-containing protein [Archaeoglobus profundus]|uniref:AtoB5 n=1 Tax=Archaeoglobus profundus (strain DSM 5631 / JCM 9629 / NBRC 100127 / Av18) TaxID=572546 RepID=D2RDF1_ARCPA|nr:beta-ketoacyl synthase N-terminal-like domain-containing protein [Archaeoglobus profundus]ADB58145.1 AtoB5 [Archaeoglobus profundus DSM 5631]